MKNGKYALIAFALLAIVIFTPTVLLGNSISGLESVQYSETETTTELGDKFFITYEKRAFPKININALIKDNSGQNTVGRCYVGKEDRNLVFNVIINTNRVRCYGISIEKEAVLLVYRVDNMGFRSIYVNMIAKSASDDYPGFVVVAKQLMFENLGWFKDCARFLINSNDKETAILLNRFANDQFTNEENDFVSELAKSDIKAFAQSVMTE